MDIFKFFASKGNTYRISWKILGSFFVFDEFASMTIRTYIKAYTHSVYPYFGFMTLRPRIMNLWALKDKTISGGSQNLTQFDTQHKGSKVLKFIVLGFKSRKKCEGRIEEQNAK